MEKRLVEFHPSLVIAHCVEGKEKGKLFLSVYDSGYFMKAYVDSANLPGGNPSHKKGDRSPLDCFIREITEEYNPEFQGPNHDALVFGQKVDWALPEDITPVKDALLAAKPWEDFYVIFSKQITNENKNGDPAARGLHSVFYSHMPSEVIEIVRRKREIGKVFSSEGNCDIFTLDSLLNSELKEFAVAHAAAPILNKYFDVKIPFPDGIITESLGATMRKSYSYYQNDFSYSREMPKPGKPSFHEAVFGLK